jgi:Transmembrane Fragile-X-F protein.
MGKESSSNSGIGFVGLLQILFIALKLCGVIDWSWWWVLSPIWFEIFLVILVTLIYVIGIIIKVKADERKRKKLREN